MSFFNSLLTGYRKEGADASQKSTAKGQCATVTICYKTHDDLILGFFFIFLFL